MKNRTLFLLALAIGFFYLCGSVGASVPYDDYQLTLPQFRQSNGTLTIYVLKDGDWQSQGALTLDKYYREKNIQLNLGDNPDSQVQIKLIQDGGGSAHIDAATLGGRSATALVPETPVGLAKLAARDFDVLHGVDHAIELVFDNPEHRDLFSITARIEAERLVEIPFQLPLTNMYKKMGPKSRFWSYPLDSHRATPDNSRHLDSIGKSTPFFKELLKAGSGHPSDYVYGWVQNDDDNLHVIMDLTGDNTMDGEKDYAKVYVNTPNGLKTFKITQSANQWGEPSFIYTDKVNWQHKVYTFRIPFEDIGLNPAEMDDTLELAFAAYGTLSGPSFSKVFTPDTIGPGSVSTLTFTIVNTEPFLVKELAFTDVLPAGVTIADPANSFTDCGGSATLSAPDGGGTITFSDSQLGVGESCTVVVDVTSSTPGMHSNVSGDLTSDMGNSGSAADDLTVVTTLPGLSKSFAPSSIPLGGRSTLTFTIDNSANESSVQNLDFTDNLPTGMLIADPADASTDCGTATLTATPGTSVITLDANGSPALGAGATCTVMVDVTATGSGELDNLSGELLADSVTSGKANATLEVTKTDLALVKSFTDDPVPSGGTVTLEFTIHNFDRDFSATGISFTDDLAAALTDLTFDTLVSNDCGGSITGVGTTTIGLTGGSVSPQANCTIKASLSVPTAVTAGVYTNTTGAISGTVDGSPVTGNTASDNLYVEPIPLLTKEFLKVGTLLPDPVVKPGGDVVLRFTITNTSTTSGATDIEFIDELTDGSASLPPDLTSGFLPFPVTVTLPPNPDPPCGAGSSLALVSAGTDRQGLELTGGSLAVSPGAGATCTFDVTVTIPADMPTGVYTNTTEEISATVDGDTRTGEPASDTLTVISAPQLSKEFTDDPVAPGGTATLEFTLTYPADASGNATDITFTDDLAMVLTGLTANLPPSPDPPCGAGSSLTGSVGDTLLTLADGVLTPGQSCTFSLTLDVPAGATPGSYTNTTSAVGATVEGETAPALAASDDLKVTYLVFNKEFLGDPIIVGDTVTLRFTIDNTASATDATSLDFTDTLPTGVTVANPANASTTCIGGTLTAAADTDSITYTGGTVILGASCTISADVTSSSAGTYINTTGNFTSSLGSSGSAMDMLIVTGFPWAAFMAAINPCPYEPNYCYMVSDRDSTLQHNSALMKYDFRTKQVEFIGRLGVGNVEAIALSLDGQTLYAVDTDVFGTIDTTPGLIDSFTPINPVGLDFGQGSLGRKKISDIDGLAFDPTTGTLYASARHGDDLNGLDMLIMIDPVTGELVKDGFGDGEDYLVIDSGGLGLSHTDDIAINSNGIMFGVVTNSGGGGGDLLVTIDKESGAVSPINVLKDGVVSVQDMEGLTYYFRDTLFGTTGVEFSSVGKENSLFKINAATGQSQQITPLDGEIDGFMPYDFEAISCPICE